MQSSSVLNRRVSLSGNPFKPSPQSVFVTRERFFAGFSSFDLLSEEGDAVGRADVDLEVYTQGVPLELNSSADCGHNSGWRCPAS